MNNAEKEEAEKLLLKMKMKDPFKKQQRQALIATIKFFNEQLELKLDKASKRSYSQK